MKLKIAASAGIVCALSVISAPAQNNLTGPVGSPDKPVTLVRMNSAEKPRAAPGQPVISSVNSAADYSLVVAPGSLAVIFGTNLAISTASASAVPLPTALGGATVSVNGRNAPLLYASANQINLQIPYETAAGTANVTVTAGNQTSATFQVVVTSTAVGVFGYGAGRGIIQNADYSLNGATNPAAAGSVVVVYLTGIGVPTVNVADGAAAPGGPLAMAKDSYSASIGGATANVAFLGLTPGLVGLAQANITIPNLATGDYALTITLTGHQSTSVTISVSGTGTTKFNALSALTQVSSVAVTNGTGAFLAANSNGLSGGSVAVYGNYLYVCGTSGVSVVDITTPASPKVVYEFGDSDLNSGGGYLAIYGGGCSVRSSGSTSLLTITDSQYYIVAYSLANPAKPTLLSTLYVNTFPGNIAFNGNIGFFRETHSTYDSSSYIEYVTEGYIGSADYSNPANPVTLTNSQYGSSPANSTSNLRLDMILASPSVLYSASTNAANTTTSGTGVLDVFDVSKPASITGTNRIQVPGTQILVSLATQGSQMIALGETKGWLSPGTSLGGNVVDFPFTGNLTLTFFDISNPASPVMGGNYYFPTLSPDGCRAFSLSPGFYALSCGAPDLSATGEGLNGSLYILDVRDPANPNAYLYATIEGLGGLTVANGYLYAATTTGANIYKIQTP